MLSDIVVPALYRAPRNGSERARKSALLLRVAVCIDASPLARKIVPHAVALARTLGAELTLLQVIEPQSNRDVLPDPVSWDIQRRAARMYLERLAGEQNMENNAIRVEIIEGAPAEQICRWTREYNVDLTVLSSHGEGGIAEWSLGNTARNVIDRIHGSFLLVPASVPEKSVAKYRRVLVPLDGSSRAESALPLAVRVAKANDADLIVVHVVPVPELTETGPLEMEDVELRDRLVRRNERVAREYLNRVRARIADQGVQVRTRVIFGGEVRSRLAHVLLEENAEFVVLSSHGQSGCTGVALGGIAAYLTAHATTPMLVVRGCPPHLSRRVAVENGGRLRLPEYAML